MEKDFFFLFLDETSASECWEKSSQDTVDVLLQFSELQLSLTL